MTTALSFIFVLGVLIFIHELGHFAVAKWVGIKVDRFSLGFPPNLVTYKRGQTEYCIGIIPLGGYVKMAGENPDETATGAPDEFMSKSVLQRTGVIFAGPFMNYVLAIVILAGIFFIHGEMYTDKHRAVVGQVIEEMPALEAGILENDIIVAVDGEAIVSRVVDGDTITAFGVMREKIYSKVEVPVEITWLRGTDTMTATITTHQEILPNIEGGTDTVGMIGIGEQIAGVNKIGFFESISRGFIGANFYVEKTVAFVKQVVFGEASFKMIGGPIFIAQQSGQQAERGMTGLFLFMALLSVNLAVLNVLPIPILDGGQLTFLLFEKIKGKPLTMKTRLIAQQVGLVAILALVVAVTYNDIMRVVGG
jgi:regulator of sigma E protease